MGDRLLFVPLGGSGEIGMNLNLYGFGPSGEEDWIVVDVGVTFGDAETPGIDLIMPDPTFIAERRDRLRGIVLTHAHEDHIGAIGYLWPELRAPIYATPFTAAMARGKLAEAGLSEIAPLHKLPLGARHCLGPFDLEYVPITHSIPEMSGLAIRTPLGLVFHTGDWKIDPDPVVGRTSDIGRIREIGQEGVRAVVCDSTNALSPGRSGSESDVRTALIEQMSACRARVVVTTFASNAARLQSIFDAARACDRHVVLAGRSIHRVVEAAQSVGYLRGVANTVPEAEAGFLPRDKVCYVCTGSQGEPRSALWRIATGAHADLALSQGDTVIFSSKVIPGNERGVFRLYNRLAEQGIAIISEKEAPVHVSGHPNRDELADMYGWLHPEIAVPVHGEARHMVEHAALAHRLDVPMTTVPHNGAVVELAPGPGVIDRSVRAGRWYLDGTILTDAAGGPTDDRRRIGFAGFVAVTIVLDGSSRLVAAPAVVTQGIPDPPNLAAKPLEVALAEAATEAFGALGARQRGHDETVAEAVRQRVRRVLRIEWGKKPVADVRIVRVEAGKGARR